MKNATRTSTLCVLTAVCAILSGCPAGTDPPVTDVDMAGTKTMKCTPGDTKNCGCLGSTVTGVKTCGDDGTWGACDGCDVPDSNDLSSTPASCTGCAGCCDNGVCIALASETNTRCGNNGQACASCGTGTCDKSTGTCSTNMGG